MNHAEPAIQLPPSKHPYTDPSLTLEGVTLWQRTADGLYALIHWAEGFENSGSIATVPGVFELVLHYRELAARVASQTERETPSQGTVNETSEEAPPSPDSPPENSTDELLALREGLRTLEHRMHNNWSISHQDGQWWLWDHAGDGQLSGDTVLELIAELGKEGLTDDSA